MKKILLNDLKDFTYAKVFAYVHSCTEEKFEVQLARHNKLLPGKDYQQLLRDYSVAAQVGQDLYLQSTGFNYWVPCYTTTEPFSFEITISDKDCFVDTLFEIISNYINPDDAEKRNQYEIRAMVFFLQAWNNERDAICWGLIDTGHSLYEMLKDAKINA